MTMILEEQRSESMVSASQRLRRNMAAVRVMFTWLGVRKSLTSDQKSQAAERFGAEQGYLSAGKKLLDVSHPAFRAVTSLRGRVIAFWKGMTLPYPEPGIRLIRQDDIQLFTVQMASLKAELGTAVDHLNDCYDELKAAAGLRLGRLFDRRDYPRTLRGWFDVSYDFPSIDPPDYLRQLSPQLYEQEARRASARFDEAVALAETAFTDELSKLVSHLTERLHGSEDGKPKVFRDSAVENLAEFFQRFRHLNIRSSAQLDDLVGQAQRVVQGIEPQALRDDQTLRQRVATQLSGVQSVLDGLLVDRPRRNIMRRPR